MMPNYSGSREEGPRGCTCTWWMPRSPEDRAAVRRQLVKTLASRFQSCVTREYARGRVKEIGCPPATAPVAPAATPSPRHRIPIRRSSFPTTTIARESSRCRDASSVLLRFHSEQIRGGTEEEGNRWIETVGGSLSLLATVAWGREKWDE